MPTNQDQPTRLCKDCKFFQQGGKCGHDSAVIVDYVGGENRRFPAQTHRQWNGPKDCGRDARFFEPAMLDITPRVPRLEVVS